jgi:hypothetical protein
METILFVSAYMRLIFGLEVEYLYFSDFQINIEKKLYSNTIQIHNRVPCPTQPTYPFCDLAYEF